MNELDIPPQNNPYGIQGPKELGLFGEPKQHEPTPEEVEQFKQAMREEAEREEAEQRAREAAAAEAEARAEKVRQDKAEIASIKVEKERVVEKETATHIEKTVILPIETVELPGPVALGRKPAGGTPVEEPGIPVLASERRERGDRRPDDPESTFTVTQAAELKVVAPSGYVVPGKPEAVKTDAGVVAVAGVAPSVDVQLKDGVPVVKKSETLITPEGTTLVVPPGSLDSVPKKEGIPITASLETTALEPIPSEPVVFGSPAQVHHSSPAVLPGTLPGTVPQPFPGETTVAALHVGPNPNPGKAGIPVTDSPETLAFEPMPSGPEAFGNPPREIHTQSLYATPTDVPGSVPGTVPGTLPGSTPGAVPPAAPEESTLEGFPAIHGKSEGSPVPPAPVILSSTTLPESELSPTILDLPADGKSRSVQPGIPVEGQMPSTITREEFVATATFSLDDPGIVLPQGNNQVVAGGSENETFSLAVPPQEGKFVPTRSEGLPPGSEPVDVPPEITLAAVPEREKTAAPPAAEEDLHIEADLPAEADIPVESFVDVGPETPVIPEDGSKDPIAGEPVAGFGGVETEALLPSETLDEPIPGQPKGSPLEKTEVGAPTPKESVAIAAEADDDNLAEKPAFNLAAPAEFTEREAPVAGEEDILLEGAGRIEQTEREDAEFWSRKETETDFEDTDRELDMETEFIIRRNEEIAEAEDPAALEAAYPIVPAAWGVNVEASPLPPAPQPPPGGTPLTQEIISLVSQVLVTDDPYAQAPEMRLTLHESVLPGTEIRFRTEGGVLEVTLYSETGESADILKAEAPELESALEGTTGGQVRVRVVSGNDSWDGRG